MSVVYEPKDVEKAREPPFAAISVTKPAGPFVVVWKAPAVVGKSVETVVPATMASPLPSTATARALSSRVPPNTIDQAYVPVDPNFTTKESLSSRKPPSRAGPRFVVAGKSSDMVKPAT
jgi:hypothetical protein